MNGGVFVEVAKEWYRCCNCGETIFVSDGNDLPDRCKICGEEYPI